MALPSAERLPTLSPLLLETCLTILRQMPTKDEAERLSNISRNPNDTWFSLARDQAHKTMYGTFGSYFGSTRSDEDLAELAKILCYNTKLPFSETEEDSDRWIGQHVGSRIRWETVGIMFTHWAELSCTSAVMGPTEVPDSRLHAADVYYLRTVNVCIDLCRSLTTGNSLLLFVLLRRCVLESLRSGDASEYPSSRLECSWFTY